MSIPAASMQLVAHELCGDRAGTVVELARLCFRPGDQLLQRLGAVGGEHRQHRYGLGRQGDRHEVVERIVGQALVEKLVHHQRRIDRHEQRVAVGRRLRGRLGADQRVGAGPVLDQDRLAPVLAHLLADDARHDVARAARRERHDDADRPVGIGAGVGPLLRDRMARRERGDERAQQCKRTISSDAPDAAQGILPRPPSRAFAAIVTVVLHAGNR